jgi:hypothetical protein
LLKMLTVSKKAEEQWQFLRLPPDECRFDSAAETPLIKGE